MHMVGLKVASSKCYNSEKQKKEILSFFIAFFFFFFFFTYKEQIKPDPTN